MCAIGSDGYEVKKTVVTSSDFSEIKLSEILDRQTIQTCFEAFSSFTHFTFAILDMEGNILTSMGFKDICMKFHRANPDTCKNCHESDTHLTQGVSPGEFRMYKCLNNLYDVVTPIFVGKRHLGNLFFGQFLLADDPADEEIFMKQAERYNFDRNEYLAALKTVPRLDRKTIENIMGYLYKVAYLLSSEAYKNIQLSRLLEKGKHLVKSLKESKEKYRLLVENQTDFILKTDAMGNILYASPSYCRMVGQTERDLPGKPYRNLMYGENLSDIKKMQQKILEAPYACCFEEKVKTANGWRWIQWTEKAETGRNGEIISLIGMGRDVTERKQLEEELRASEAKHRTMIENILDVLMIIDENRIIKYISSNIQKFFGWSAEELLGRKAFERIHPDDRNRYEKMFSGLIEEDNCIKTGEFRYLVKDGSYRDVEVTEKNLLKDPVIKGVMINFHDITRYKSREDEVRYLSYRDVMTGLYNRTFFTEEINRLKAKNHLPLSVIMGDVNGLKLINDGFGHTEGDKVLVQIAGILKKCCRKNDIICRIGGDEFCILLPKTDSGSAHEISRRIYKACEENANGKIIKPSISLGYETRTDAKETIENVIKRAEAFMYRHKLLEGRSEHGSLIGSIKATMFEKSQDTEEHAERLAIFTKALGQKLSLNEEELNQLELLAMLHDLGKMSVDKRILEKRGKLTENEWMEIKKHPEAGYRIALASPELVHIADFILCHHENWDGSGYPQGLKGEEIPLLSRIVAVVDAYDAMSNDRPYKKARSKDAAIQELRKYAGTQFDPNIVDAFLGIL